MTRVPSWHDAAVWLTVAAVFLSFELPPVFWTGCPWNTLSESTWRLESWWHLTRIFFALFFVALAAHIVRHVPVRYLLTVTVAAGLAVAVHVLWDRLRN